MGDQDGKIEPLVINTIPGNKAPRWDAETCELTPLGAHITERGMRTGWPMVDLVFQDPEGKRAAYTTSGRMMLLLAGAIQAAVIRNKHEPDYVPVMVLALQGQHPQSPSFDKALSEISTELHKNLLGKQLTQSGIEDALRATLVAVLQR